MASESITHHLLETDALAGLRRFSGKPADFWARMLEVAGSLTRADGVYLFLREASGETAKWRALAKWPAQGTPGLPRFAEEIPALLERALAEGEARGTTEGSSSPTHAGVVPLDLGKGDSRQACLLFLFKDTDDPAVRLALEKARLLADRPALFRRQLEQQRLQSQNRSLASLVDLLLLVNREERFLPAAMVVCNELAGYFGCERVSLGWYHNSQVRLRAISHSEKFEKKMEVVRLMELAMEECIDQDSSVCWPDSTSEEAVIRDHARYAREAGVSSLASIPLRARDRVCAVLLLERSGEPFPESAMDELQIFANQLGPPLHDRRESDHWWGARLYFGFRKHAARWIGYRNTGWKIAGLFIALALGFLFFGKIPYRVEAPFTLQSTNVITITTPFEGYLSAVYYEAGESVTENTLLGEFDTQELLLEQAVIASDYTRHVREAERHRADHALAEMRIAEAQAEQVRAELDRIRFRLDRAEIRAPFDGVLVKGDLREREGSRFQTGEELFRIVRLDELYLQIHVAETDIHELTPNSVGQVAFKSRPGRPFPIHVTRIEPVAQTIEEGNVFQVRAELTDPAEPWLRPGMSGVAKLDVEPRPIYWVLTHRTVDFLRLHVFWW